MKYNDYLLLHKRSISSTNDYLIQHCNTLPNKTLIYADKQTCGRGRQSNRWNSPVGNLYASFLYNIELSLMRILPELSQIVALSVKSICDKYIKNSDSIIKWPNDILVNQNKIAGILIETLEQGMEDRNNYRNHNGHFVSNKKTKTEIINVIIGIGININSKSDFTCTINQPATSLYRETGKKTNVKNLLLDLIDEVDKNINTWINYGFISFFNVWKKNVMIKGRSVLFFNDGIKTSGFIQDIENNKIKIEANNKFYLKNLCDIIVQ